MILQNLSRALLCVSLTLVSATLALAATPERVGPAAESSGDEVTAQASLQAAFAAAYQRYPGIPAGTLEAIAFTATRGMAPPTQVEDTHLSMPIPVGVMGLHRGEGGFTDLVGAASRLTGLSASVIESNTAGNVMAAAALLATRLPKVSRGHADIESLTTALASLSGIPTEAKTASQRYALDAYAYDVLLSYDRGNDDGVLKFPGRPVAFDKAFDQASLETLRAPFLRIDLGSDRDSVAKGLVDPADDSLRGPGYLPKSTDYAPALWVASPNFSARTVVPSSITIHTMQGTYAGSISWFANAASQVSAHYLVRSSDGQITQMVRNASKAWHVGIHNNYTLGIEHEGYVNNAAWYTAAMYSASGKLSKHLCTTQRINCASAYKGASSSAVVPLTGFTVKGHQHYSSQSHTDPGINWDWPRYYTAINGSTAVAPTIIDNFEASEGHFNTAPTYSGSTVGIATTSTADRSNARPKNGSWSERIVLNDNTASSANWAVRLLSGSGSPAQNRTLAKAGGRIGFWAYASTSGVSLAVGVDDSDGTERSTARALSSNVWTFVEWQLDNAAQWDPWSGGNGSINGSTTLDAIWLFRAQATTAVTIYIDDVRYRVQ